MADLDPRFARLKTDPRFRKPKRKESKVQIDPRFNSLFEHGALETSKKRKRTAAVDKYGRVQSKTRERDQLRRFYRLDDDDGDPSPTARIPDYARGELLMESSDEGPLSDDEKLEDEEVVLERPAGVRSKPSPSPDRTDIDLDESAFPALEAQAAAYSGDVAEPTRTTVPGHETSRLAVVNLDWDHVRASDLFRVFASVTSGSSSSARSNGNALDQGRILSVRVYPSEFGKERLRREETEGPPTKLFHTQARSGEADEVNGETVVQVDEGEEYDNDALRKYQLERLRYYYAVVTCDSPDTAAHVYAELDGAELERSANVFDIRFVPDDMAFDDEFRDEASEVAGVAHKGLDFSTDALRHSKVKLTWDDDDPNRNRLTRRTLSRKEMDETDFKAYIASSGSEDDDDAGTRRERLRRILLAPADETTLPEGWGADGKKGTDMEITFMPGLSEAADQQGGVQENTLERYQRKQKDKKKAKRADRVDRDAAKDEPRSEGDEFFETVKRARRLEGAEGTSKALSTTRAVASAEQLSMIVADSPGNGSNPRHFDMNAVLRTEKKGKRKRNPQGSRAAPLPNEVDDSFVLDVDDDRFTVLHEDRAFALDPSHPRFKKTKGMSALLEERSRRHHKPNNSSAKSIPSKGQGPDR